MIATWKLPTSKVYHGLNNALGICVHKKYYQVLPTQMVPISALAHGLNEIARIINRMTAPIVMSLRCWGVRSRPWRFSQVLTMTAHVIVTSQ